MISTASTSPVGLSRTHCVIHDERNDIDAKFLLSKAKLFIKKRHFKDVPHYNYCRFVRRGIHFKLILCQLTADVNES